MKKSDIIESLDKAIKDGDLPALKAVLAENPKYLNYRGKNSPKKPDIEPGMPYIDFDYEFGLKDGVTPLMYASYLSKADIVEYLIKKDAKIESAENRERKTALLLAAEEGHTEVAKLLLDAGANMYKHRKALFELTPMHVAAIKNHAQVVSLLLDYGFDIETKDLNATSQKGSIVPLAILHGSTEVVEVLLDRKPNSVVNAPYSGLFIAARNLLSVDNCKIVELLLKAGENPNKKEFPSSMPPLAAACERLSAFESKKGNDNAIDNAVEVIKLLVKAGAKIERKVFESYEIKSVKANKIIKSAIVEKMELTPANIISAGANAEHAATQASLERP